MLKKSLVCAVMLVIVAGLALASTGSGKKKLSKSTPNPAFIPARMGSFSLKLKPEYSANSVLNSFSQKSNVMKSVITYQKGNTIYVMPSQFKLSSPPTKLSFKSNLNVVDLKIRICNR